MYKDLSLKEKAKVLLYGGKLGLTSVEDIAKLYDEAIEGHLKLGNTTSSSYISNGYNPEYEGAQIYADNRNWWERNIASPVNTYFNNLSQRAPEFVSALLMFTPVGLVTDLANGNTESAMSNIGAFNIGKDPELVKQLLRKYNKDKFVNYLERKTGKTIKRVPIKDSKIGDVYSEGFSYVDDKGEEIAHIAGNKSRGNNVFVESSYISPEFRNQGIGKQMYFDFNQNVYDNFGTTLHSSPYQHQATVEVEPGSGVFISPSSKLWRGLKLKEMAEIGGQGLDKYYIMSEPLKLKPMIEYKKGGPIVSPYGQWKYPGRDTIIPSNNITMDNVNYPVLGISDAGDVKIMMPWNDYKFRGSMVYEHPLIDNQFQLGGNTKPTFDLWYPTVPKQKNDTSSYDLRRAYNTLPFDEMEKFRTINDYHLPSVAYDEKTDTYTFLKRNGHPTLNYELDWYNSGRPDALEFRERYKLDTLNLPWRYVPITYLNGGGLYLERIKPIEEFITPLEPMVLDNTYVVRNYPYYLLPEVLDRNKRLSDEELSNYYASNILWTMENPKHKGLNSDGTYSAYEDEAGFNFGPGLHAKSNNLDINKTYTKLELDSIASNIALNYMKLISEDLETMLDGKYAGARDTLSAGPLLTMLDIAYNVKPKNKGNMPLKWPNLTDSLINGNIEKAKENTYSGSTRRQKMRNQMIVYKPLEGITVHNEALGGNLFKKGGIYINPKNKGKFNATKKRTGKTTEELTHSKNPITRKRAIFAQNARKWNHKHDEGGYLYSEGGFLLAPYLYNE